MGDVIMRAISGETLLFALAILLGTAPLLWRVRARGARVGLLAVALPLSAVCAWGAVRTRTAVVLEHDVEIRPIEIEDTGYTSSDACQSCHPDQYATWYRSYHRTMTQVAGPDTVIGDFDPENAGSVTLSAFGRTERLWREGDTFWVEMPNPAWRPSSGEAQRIERQIVMTTGSHNMQFYWYSTGNSREVGLVSFVWLTEQARWLPYAAEGMAPPPPHGAPVAATGTWNRGCAHCHTTRAKMRIQPNPVRSSNPLAPHKNLLDTHVTEFGIACEACHGPGEEHALRNRNPGHRYSQYIGDDPDPSIVNPKRLSPRRANQVCGQCHGVVLTFNPSERGRGQQRLSQHGFRYRPGDDLSETRTIVRPKLEANREVALLLASQPRFLDERFWADGEIRVTGRELNAVMDSPCFREGLEPDELSCLSCHQLHQQADDPRSIDEWANDMLAPGMLGDEACLQCHGDLRPAIAAHSHHAAESSGSRCYNCHMPYTSYGLLKAIRSHTIGIPDVADSVSVGRPNACNQCHLDKTLAWSAGWLEEWYDIPEPPLDLHARTVPASLVWLLRGDAGQRALAAWTMGWRDALDASGDEWPAAFLPTLFLDPYANVRSIAQRSFRQLPGFAAFEFDPMSEPTTRRNDQKRALERWRMSRLEAGELPDGSWLLVDPEGALPPNIFAELLSERDDRVVVLKE